MIPADFRAAATYYISRGWPVFPIHGLVPSEEGLACTCGDPTCDEKTRGKHPANNHGHLDATTDPQAVTGLWADLVTRNLAIATGLAARLAVIDIDPRNGGHDAWDEFERLNPDTTFNTHSIATGGGGLHLYYLVDVATPTIPNLLRGVDLKADGGYVLAPPSTHVSGGSYSTVQPVPATLSPLPAPVLEIITSGQRPAGLKHTPAGLVSAAGLTAERQREILADPSTLGPGERDIFFTFTARDFRRGGASFEETVRALAAVYERMQNPGDDQFSPEALVAKVQRAFQQVDPEPSRENREIAQRLQQSALRLRVHDLSPLVLEGAAAERAAGILERRGRLVEDATTDETEIVTDANHWGTWTTPALTPGSDDPAPTPVPANSRRVLAAPDGYLLPDSLFEVWDGERPEAWLANDDGVAALAQAQWGHKLRFDLDTEDWLVYDPTPVQQRWVQRASAEATELMKLTVRSIERVIAMDEEDTVIQDALLNFALRSLNDGPVKAAMRSLATRSGIRLHHEELDDLNHVLPVENGVIEPQFFGEEYADVPFRRHRPEDLFTRHAHLRYDSHAIAPFWEANLIKWFPDPAVRGFVQRLLGYAVFGNGQEKVFVVAHGHRDSGKSAFFNNVRDLLGDFAITLNAQSITKQRFPDQNHFDLAHISGARLILSSETARGASYDAELLKLLASGGEDAIRVRFLRENFVEVRNKGLLVIMTNHLPRNDELDDALWSRLMILPFDASFPADDPGTIRPEPFKRLLHQERDGVLRWFVEGYSNYQASGLQPPPASLAAAAAARQEEDWLGAYVDARLTVDPQSKTTVASVNADYEVWCHEVGDQPVKPRAFRALLGDQFRKARGGGGIWYFYGITLKNPAPESAALPPSWRP